MRLEDKITVAVVGGIGSHKHILRQEAEKHPEILLQARQGNFWVPKSVNYIFERRHEELFRKYSADPEKYSFVYQMQRMAEGLEQHDQMEETSGLVFTGHPLEVDRIFSEANRENIGDAFSTYEAVYEQVSKIVKAPHIIVYCRIPPESYRIAQERIRKTGRSEEQKFVSDPSYLIKLFQLFEERFMNGKREKVIVIDATDPALDKDNNEEYLQRILTYIAEKVRELKSPPRLSIEELEAVDYNSATNASRVARRELRQYLQEQLKIITLAGLPSSGKTGLAQMLSGELECGLSLELQGRNDQIKNELLSNFLQDKKTYARALQFHLIQTRAKARLEMYAKGKSFIEDRSPDEDIVIFSKRLLADGNLTEAEFLEIEECAKNVYAQTPQSDLVIKVVRSPGECRSLMLSRGRPEEIAAWPKKELGEMDKLYETLFPAMKPYNSNKGPTLELHMPRIDPKNSVHQGYIFQEILHELLSYDRTKAKPKLAT